MDASHSEKVKNHPSSHKIEFDYCQFRTDWKKPTAILSVGNKLFHTGKSIRCKVAWYNKVSICSKTGKTHTTLSGFVGGATKGQYNTNKACPYPPDFCTYVAEFIYEPAVQFAKKNGGTNTVDEKTAMALPIGPAVSMHAPPPEQLDASSEAPRVQGVHEMQSSAKALPRP